MHATTFMPGFKMIFNCKYVWILTYKAYTKSLILFATDFFGISFTFLVGSISQSFSDGHKLIFVSLACNFKAL